MIDLILEGFVIPSSLFVIQSVNGKGPMAIGNGQLARNRLREGLKPTPAFSTFQLSNSPTFQLSNFPTLQLSNSPTLQLPNSPTLKRILTAQIKDVV